MSNRYAQQHHNQFDQPYVEIDTPWFAAGYELDHPDFPFAAGVHLTAGARA